MKSSKAIFAIAACGAILLFPWESLQAQCYQCEDNEWHETVCAIASWDGIGQVDCNDMGAGCTLSGPTCWGDDPWFAWENVRPDGTMADGGIPNELFLSKSAAYLVNPAPWAVAQERACDGVITARSYGVEVRRQLERSSSAFVI